MKSNDDDVGLFDLWVAVRKMMNCFHPPASFASFFVTVKARAIIGMTFEVAFAVDRAGLGLVRRPLSDKMLSPLRGMTSYVSFAQTDFRLFVQSA